MAIPANPNPAPAREDTLSVRGALVATADLQRHLSNYQPPDLVWIFRDGDAWTLLTFSRSERWDDDGTQERHRCHAQIVSVRLASIDELADRIRGRYGEAGWHGVLDAGRTDPDLFRAWAPVAIERELEAARFFREQLVASIGRFTSREIDAVMADIELQLLVANFGVVAVDRPARPTRPGENLVMAQALVRKYGLEADVIVRMDRAGEVYFRVAEESVVGRRSIREVEVDDD